VFHEIKQQKGCRSKNFWSKSTTVFYSSTSWRRSRIYGGIIYIYISFIYNLFLFFLDIYLFIYFLSSSYFHLSLIFICW